MITAKVVAGDQHTKRVSITILRVSIANFSMSDQHQLKPNITLILVLSGLTLFNLMPW